MTIEQCIAELPPMPRREDADRWIDLFPKNDTIKAAAIAGFHQANEAALDARLSLLTEAVRKYLEAVDAYRGAYPKLDLSDEEAEWQEAEADLRAVVKVMP